MIYMLLARLAAAIAVFLLASNGFAEPRGNQGLCSHFAMKAEESFAALCMQADRQNVLAVTNAGLFTRGRQFCPEIVPALETTIGVSTANGSLIVLQDKPEQSLFLFVFDRKRNAVLYLESPYGSETVKVSSSRRDFLNIFQGQQEFDAFLADKPFGGREYLLATLASLWAKGLLSLELLNVIRLHDHYCPGVTSGYHISKYILEEFRLSEGQRYVVIAAPIWCKDDAIQVMLNATVGKRSMYALAVNDKDKDCLIDEAKNTAGIFFRYNSTLKEGDAVVIAYDWNRLRADAGAGAERSAISSIKTTEFMASTRDAHRKYVSVIKKIKLEKGQSPEEFVGIGVNPFQKAGIWKKGCGPK